MAKDWVSIVLLVAWIVCCVVLLVAWIVCGVRFVVLLAVEAQGKADVTIHNAEYYPLTACVIEIDREGDIVTVEDSTGNCWQFYGVEDWQIGDGASLLMWDNGTESIADDEVHNAWTLTH